MAFALRHARPSRAAGGSRRIGAENGIFAGAVGPARDAEGLEGDRAAPVPAAAAERLTPVPSPSTALSDFGTTAGSLDERCAPGPPAGLSAGGVATRRTKGADG